MHPIDRLGEIRQQIRQLRLEAKSIAQQLASGACSNRGQHYVAYTRRSILVTPIPHTPMTETAAARAAPSYHVRATPASACPSETH